MGEATKGQPTLWRLGGGDPPDGPYVALAPGSEVPLLPVDLPDGLGGLARERVAQRELAEALAMPLQGLEIRPYRRKGAPWRRALVAEAEVLDGWRSAVTEGCRGILPDYLSLPCIPGVWTVAAGSDDVGARLGTDDGFTAEPDLAAALLAGAEPPAAVLRLGEPCAPVDEVIAGLDVPVFGDAAALEAAGHGRPLPWADAVQGLDLLPPPLAAFDRIRAGLRRWSVPAVAAVLALAIWMASIVVETRQLAARATAAWTQTEEMVRAHFVPAGPLLDVRAQVSRALADTAPPPAPEPDPLLLLQQAAPLLASADVALQAVTYSGQAGLVAAVDLTDFAALEQLVTDLRAQGFAVDELDSAARQAGGVAARLRLVGAGG